jgi:H+-transporting ATPase
VPSDSHEGGLDAEEVRTRLAQYGRNEIPEKKSSLLARLARPFWGPISWMLEVIAVVSWLGHNPVTAVIMVGLLVFNAALVLVREGKARKAMSSLRQQLRIQSRVRRDGNWSLISSREIVPGDLVRIRAGDIVAADSKILDGSLDVDQSALTGESLSSSKSPGDVIFSGSTATRGEATATVIATGTNTHFGRTVELVDLATPKLHMEETVKKVTRSLFRVSIIAIIVTLFYASFIGIQNGMLLPIVAVLLIAALPVAMPTMFTLSMALGATTLAREGVLITRLSASEDAAAMDVLCVDKTGTMTQNKLFVEKELPVNGYRPSDITLFGALASNEADQDPVDLAFLAAANAYGVKLDSYRQLDFIPFDPQSRMTGATVESPSEKFLVRKGSLGSIISAYGVHGGDAEGLGKESEVLAAEGLKVIAVAKGTQGGIFQLVGLAGVADRIREDSRAVVEQLNTLGVSTKMLTGDSLPIARNVAKQIGFVGEVTKIPDGHEEKGATLPASIIEQTAGLAEIYPEDKYAIVKSLQGAGHVVGMTGDGVNDSPALKQAEVGIAVKSATDVAKDSASAVLVTDGLDGTVALVKTARTVYERLQNWVINMITKKTFVIAYIVAMLILTRNFVVSVLGMVLLLFLGDFATMSASTDNVPYSMKPASFDVPWLFKLGASLGLASTIEGIAITITGIRYFGLAGSPGQLYTFGFAFMVLVGLFNLLIVRERHNFWGSRPSNLLLITAGAEILIVSAISLLGFLDLAPIGIIPLVTVLAFSASASFN